MRRLITVIEEPGSDLPEAARATLQVLVDVLRHLDERIAELDAEIVRRARQDEVARRLMTIPGIGPLIATALAMLAPPPEHFRCARDFAAWMGLTPPAAFDRWQAAPRVYNEDGRALAEAIADHRRE